MVGPTRVGRAPRTLRVLLLTAALILGVVVPGGAAAADAGSGGADAGLAAAHAGSGGELVGVLIALEPDAPAGLARALGQLGGEVTDDLDALDFVNARIPAGQLAAVRAMPGVTEVSEHVEVDLLLDTTTRLVGAVAADDTEADASFAGTPLTGAGTTIAVIDDGVLAGHEFFSDGSSGSRVVAEGCFATADCPAATGEGAAAPQGDHGTHVAGVAAGFAPAGAGPARGVAPDAGIIAVQVFDAAKTSNSSAITAAMNWIVEEVSKPVPEPAFAQLSVVNLSLGTGPSSDCPAGGAWEAFDQAARDLAAKGVLTVAAAGNNSSRTAMSYPACLDSVVGVGATELDPTDAIANFSNLSNSTAIVAPGRSVYSAGARSNTDYWRASGTSMAAPHVAGAVALLAEAAPHSSAADRLEALRAAAPGTLIDDQRTGDPAGTVKDLPPLNVRWALGELPAADAAPATPTGVQVTIPSTEGNPRLGELQVDWTPVPEGAAAGVTHHAVAHPGGRFCTDTANLGTCTITGLADETAYTVRVTATDGDGRTSAASLRTDPVTTTEGLPGEVRDFTGTVDSTDVDLTWTAPAVGSVTSYTVSLTSSDGGTVPSSLPAACAETTPGCTITGLTQGHSYLATVRANNDVGHGPDTTFAFTPGRPSEPRDVLATRGDGAVTVTWTAPEDDGGTAINGYVVTTREPDDTLTDQSPVDAATRSSTVTGLTNGVRYRFSVTATNPNGPGASSAESAEVTPAGPPSAPGDVSITVPATSGALDVSWTASDPNGAEVKGYLAVADPGGQHRSCAPTTATATSCQITGLTNGTQVAVTVTATNEVDSTPAAPVSGTPRDPNQTTSGGGGGGGGGSLPPEETDDTDDDTDNDEAADGPVTVGGSTPAPTTGTSQLLVGGEPATSTITSTLRSLVLDTAGIRSELGARGGDGTPSPVRAGMVTLPPGGHLDVATAGLSPGTQLVGWLFSEPVRLGALPVGANGSSTGAFAVPDALAAGAHTLQLVATRADGEQVAWSVGIRLEPIASRFPDVNVGVTHWFAIESIAEQGVTLGDAAGNYRPAASVTRGQMARFLARQLALPAGGSSGLSDIDGIEHQQAIEAIVAAGIAGGFPDGTFRPNDPVTRGQLATFLAAAAELDEVADGPSTDVAGTTHERRIHAVVAAGIASGFADGTYRPGVAVTRAQMATLLVGLDEELASR